MTIIPIPFRANWYPARSGNAWKKAASPRVDLNDFGERLPGTFYQKTGLFSPRTRGSSFSGRGPLAIRPSVRPWTPRYDCRPASVRRLSRAKNRRSTSSNSLNTGWLMSPTGAPKPPPSSTRLSRPCDRASSGERTRRTERQEIACPPADTVNISPSMRRRDFTYVDDREIDDDKPVANYLDGVWMRWWWS